MFLYVPISPLLLELKYVYPNRNWFRVAFLFSLFGLFFPEYFPNEFKTEGGTVHLYFEATTVILTLVLLGQLLEAKAHSRTSGAIKELLKLCPQLP
jgi:Cu2+-exporting ATPase